MSVTTTSAATVLVSHRPPRRALRKLIVTEFKAACRDPAWLVLGLGVPVILLVIFGLAPGFQKQNSRDRYHVHDRLRAVASRAGARDHRADQLPDPALLVAASLL